MAIGKILELSDKISAGRIFEVDFEKNQKNVKNVSKKNLYCIVVWLKKYFFSKTKDEIDYSKCYKTISMPFSWYYIFFELIQRDFGLHLPIIRIRIIKTKNSALKSDNAPGTCSLSDTWFADKRKNIFFTRPTNIFFHFWFDVFMIFDFFRSKLGPLRS